MNLERHRRERGRSVNVRVGDGSSRLGREAQNGKVKAVKKGTCYIYAYTQSGVFKKIRVKVK